MRKFEAVIIFLLFCVLTASAAEIRGTVVSTGQNPVEGAVVLHRASGATTETDAEGRFALDVPDSERVRLEVIHPDYYENEFALTRKDLERRIVLALVPLIRQREEIVVTALRYPEPSVKVPAAGSVVQNLTLAEKMVPNITEGLKEVAGVSALGSGGFSLVPTIRGLSRRRILFLIDGAKIESDRRTGPNASFLNPSDIARIEVLRSPSSVFYGSDAIGGVIHMFTMSPDMREGLHGRLSAGYGTVNGEKGLGLALQGATGDTGFYVSFNSVDAGNYSSPLGEVMQSQFTQGSLLAKALHRTDRREIELGFLGTRGTDIGKPNRTSEVKPTWYPRENQNLLQFRWREMKVGGDGEVNFQAFVNPNFLETRTDSYDFTPIVFKSREAFSRTESTEFGVQLSYGEKLGPAFRLEGGADLFGRAGAEAFNKYLSFDGSGAITEVIEERPFVRGRRQDLGFFLTADYDGIRNIDLLGGVRWDLLDLRADPGGGPDAARTRKNAATGFLAASYGLGGGATAFLNFSKAYRVPSLSELFYTGISGRGFIVANPDLVPETSRNVDGGIKVLGRRFFAAFYGFRYEIDDMIERYRVEPATYTYGNIERGRLQGLELELEVFPLRGWRVFGNIFTIRGRSVLTGDPLNDIPPFHFFAGTRVWRGRFSAEVNGTFQLAKSNPGPAEIALSPTELLNLKASYAWRSLNIYVTLSNLFNAAYVARPDAEAMEEPGRNLKIGFVYSF